VKQSHPDFQEEKCKSILCSEVSQKARGKNVTITLNEEFCKGVETCVEICPKRCVEVDGAYPMARIPKETDRLNLSTLEAGIELALEAYNNVPPDAEFVGDKLQGLGKGSDV
jgi:MinD superfamily P-loop ATPase